MPIGASTPAIYLSGMPEGRARSPARPAGPTVRAGPWPGTSLRPELSLEPLRGFVERAVICACTQVFPAAICDDEGDVGCFVRFHRAACFAQRRVQDRTGRDAGEDALLLDQLAGPP